MSQTSGPSPLKCPVCSARFRGSTTCSRCGSDLSLVMKTAAAAWSLRDQARNSLLKGNLALALRQTAQARQLQRD